MCAGYEGIRQRRWGDAVAHFEAAIALDPAAYRPAGMVIQAYVALDEPTNAEAAARRCLARCEKILAVEPDHGGAMGFLVTALVTLNEADRARDWARRAVLFDPDNLRLQYNLACGMAGLRDADAACELLEGFVDKVSSSWWLWIEIDSSLDPIRDHPRFAAVVARGKARLAPEAKADSAG
jgi:adenylate cyclase